ncbi:MAG: HAMP domain-containing histidine kinase [Chitinophagaceae bacterium]|nr:HAMP domain-containing histidine kinase [Chitinophagaceae bacterium]
MKTRWSAYVMIGSIIVILLFQGYWLNRLYKEEELHTQQQVDILFRDLVYKIQLQRFKADTLIYNAINKTNLFGLEAANAIIHADKQPQKVENVQYFSKQALILKSTADSILKIIQNKKDTDTGTKIIRIMVDSARFSGGKLGTVHIFTDKKMDSVIVRDTTHNLSGKVFLAKSPLNLDFQNRIDLPGTNVEKKKSKSSITKIPKGVSYSMVMRTKPIADSIAISILDSAFSKDLKKANLSLPYHIITGKLDSAVYFKNADSISFATNIASVGLADPHFYKAVFTNTKAFIIKRILPQAFFSSVLTLLILFAFIFLYRNIVTAEKLASLKNDFISNITHELKTPVATVQVAVEALKNFDAIKNPDKTKAYLDIATIELQRLGLLVDKVLRISMFQKQGFTLNKEKLDFKLLIEENINVMKLQFERYNAQVSFESDQQSVEMVGDKLHLLSVVYNLLDNAMKYSKDSPVVKVQLKKPIADVVQLDIIDKGIGIPEAYIGKIFDRFFRVPTKDKHDVKGYGLGLSYVQYIVEAHGGVITVKSKEGEGSTFSVSLPLHNSAV